MDERDRPAADTPGAPEPPSPASTTDRSTDRPSATAGEQTGAAAGNGARSNGRAGTGSDAAAGSNGEAGTGANGDAGAASNGQARKRRRGSRGGQRRRKGTGGDAPSRPGDDPSDAENTGGDGSTPVRERGADPARRSEPTSANNPSGPDEPARSDGPTAAAAAVPARKPQIGDTRPAPTASSPSASSAGAGGSSASSASSPSSGGSQQRGGGSSARRKRRGGRGGSGGGSGSGGSGAGGNGAPAETTTGRGDGDGPRSKKRRTSRSGSRPGSETGTPAEIDPALLEQRRGRERNGRPLGRFSMCVQVRPGMTQVAVLEGRSLIEHYVSRPADDVSQIHGNIYLGKVQNVLPGMEAAFVDIATPKNAVLYRGDVQFDPDEVDGRADEVRIEQILKQRQLILCQVTKNPIGAKGARLTQEVSLPGRFVVLIPNSSTYGISKRLTDDVRKRLRNILDRVKPEQHGLIVRTAAEHATEDELRADVRLLLDEWETIERAAASAQRPTLLHREPELAVRVIREEFNAEYRSVLIDDRTLYEQVRNYVAAFNPELADRIEYYDREAEGLSLFERHHVHEQVHKALDRKVWLPSGGSLIIEHTEALTVIDVNTGKNVGTSNLEETVFHNNMEAAEEIAKQLRLRDIGGIIVIDFIDMEIKGNRAKVVEAFRAALARDKTRTQVFDISELGLVEMTRKRIGEGLLTDFSRSCPDCDGRGLVVDHSLLD